MRSSRGASILVVLIVCGSLMVGIPVLIILSKQDDVAKQSAQNAVSEFVSKAVTTAVITQEDIDNLQLTLDSSSRAWNIEIKIQRLDENPSKKVSGGSTTSGVYYDIYDSQITYPFTLHEGDTITVTGTTLDDSGEEQVMKAIFFFMGDVSQDIVQASAMVPMDGN